MKRFDAGFESLLESLPPTGQDLRLIDVVTYDPWMARPPFTPADLVPGHDVPERSARRWHRRNGHKSSRRGHS